MIKKLSLIVSLFFASYTFSQTNEVKIKFEIDGNEVNLSNDFNLYFIKAKDTFFVSIKNDRIIIPERLKIGEKVKLIFTRGKYSIAFNSFSLVINEQNPIWQIGIDEKPFNKKEHWTIKKWKKVKLIYYINNGNGGRVSVALM